MSFSIVHSDLGIYTDEMKESANENEQWTKIDRNYARQCENDTRINGVVLLNLKRKISQIYSVQRSAHTHTAVHQSEKHQQQQQQQAAPNWFSLFNIHETSHHHFATNIPNKKPPFLSGLLSYVVGYNNKKKWRAEQKEHISRLVANKSAQSKRHIL